MTMATDNAMMPILAAGIDVGSISTKAAILDGHRLLGVHIISTGYNTEQAARRALATLTAKLSIDPGAIRRIVATGYGRKNVAFAHCAVTEITCHAAGARFQDDDVRFIIDIGGQDSKVIALDADGRVADFAMNDKCAAGTGRFLEVMARALEVDLDTFAKLALTAEQPAIISSLCTVFAESEIISLIARGEKRSNIIAGIHRSIAARVAALAGRVGWAAPIMMTGGVACNMGVVRALEQASGKSIRPAPLAQANGAIGAAVIGLKTIAI